MDNDSQEEVPQQETSQDKAQPEPKSDHIRVQFDFTPESYARLEAIREVTQAKTKAEVLRNAMSLYEWFINEAKPGMVIQLLDADGNTVSRFKADLLL